MSVDRETFKHAAIYSFAAVLGRIVGLVMLPFYAHILRDVGYGIIGMTDTALSFLMCLLADGIRGAVIRIYHEEEGRDKLRVVSTGTLLAGWVTLSIVAVTMLASKPLSSLLLGDSAHYIMLCLALGAFFLDLTGGAAGSLLIIRRQSVPFSTIGLFRLTVGLGLQIYLVVILRWGLLGYFIGSLVTALLSNSIFFIICFRQCGLAYDRRIARKLFAYQLPLVPGSLAGFASRQVERILVRFMIAIESVGVLEMAYKFPVLLNLLIHQPFMRSWDTGRIQIAEEPDAPERIGRMFTYALFLITFAGLLIAVSIEDLLKILTPQEFWLAHRIAKIEVVTTILASATYHLNFGLFYTKATGVWGRIRAVMAGVKVVLSFVFIKLWGLYGAAFSACVVAAIILVWGGWSGQARYRLKIERGKILGMMIVAVGIFLVLTNVDLTQVGFVERIARDGLPEVVRILQGTFLGTWKDGKAIVLLQEKDELVLDLAVKSLLCLSFLIFFPVVHAGTRHKLLRRFSLRPAR